jgi:hypothetical protein
VKFLCLPCDRVMDFAERATPGDGTLAAVFHCHGCGHEVAMLANPMETQLVSSLGVKVGGRQVPAQPMELVRSSLADGRDDAFADSVDPPPGRPAPPTPGSRPAPPGTPAWSEDALQRLTAVPAFVRGMVKRIYTDYARDRGIGEITPAVMDRARSDLGLEGM